jgi:hypothetical protein
MMRTLWGVRHRDQLAEALDHFFRAHRRFLRRERAAGPADVVGAQQHDHGAHARLREHVAARALQAARPMPSFSRRPPELPALSTPTPRGARRSASASGQRVLAPGVAPLPSVSESPSATTVAGGLGRLDDRPLT